jgi:hypothetical protein
VGAGLQARAGSPAARAVETTYTDSVLLALRIVAINHNEQSLLLNLNDVFMTDFAQLNLGTFDANRSVWHKVKAFKDNVELEVAATFDGGRFSRGGDGVIDGRGNTVVIHYGLCRLPEGGYQPRLADDRVGFFLSAVKDFSSDREDTAFVRYVNRWRLERAEPLDPKHPHRLSPPKKKIVFWIEKSVPDEYRAAVREGILEWNKAFEKIGFRDAIEVRQQENEDFDPEDVNYNTFRWITTDLGFAMGPSRANPLTGEILDADIIFDASMVRFWRQEAQLFKAAGHPASLIQATRQGWGLPGAGLLPGLGGPADTGPTRERGSDSQGWNEPRQVERAARARVQAVRQGICQCGAHMRYELGLAAMTLAAREQTRPGEKAPDDLVNQAIKEVTMHEVGHTLGLRHNFKASTMLANDQLHDTSITRKQGLVGSVMDYTPINLAPKGVKQGDYFTTTLGPYDYWAIAYAYTPLSGGTEGEAEKLQEIARAGAGPGHDYATDEDLFASSDPLVHVWDLGADPMKFAQDRILLAQELIGGLAERVVDKGEGYQRARQAFDILLGQYGNAAFLVASYLGGEHLHRDHKDDPGARDPFVPVPAAKQRAALHFLQEHILSDKPFRYPPALLRKLGADRWMHWGNESSALESVEFPLHERVLDVQRVVLGQVYDGGVLSRIQNNALKVDGAEKPLTIAEVFRAVTDAVWCDLKDPARAGAREEPGKLESSAVRRNLQREQLKDLFTLVLGDQRGNSGAFVIFLGRPAAVPADARSLARMHLREIGRRIDGVLGDSRLQVEDTTRAHLEECRERIAKVLNASMQINEP